MPITLTTDSATISTTEYGLASDSTSITYQTTDCIMQCMIDFVNMVAGDSYEVKVYEKIDGTNARVVWYIVLEGAQPRPVVTPSLGVGNGWEVTVKRLAGSDRSVLWTLFQVT